MFCSNCGKEVKKGDKFCSSCGNNLRAEDTEIANNYNLEAKEYSNSTSSSKSVIGSFFYILGVLGSIWISIRAIIIEWMYIKESFVSFLNPFIHLKVLFRLLQDFDIYAIAICFALGYFLTNSKKKV